MFQECWLELSQDKTWLEVKLLTKWSAEATNDNEYIRQLSEEYLLIGGWKVGDNNLNNRAAKYYTVGSPVDQYYKFWRYSLKRHQLDFCEKLDGWSELKIAASLYDVQLKPHRGFVPWTGEGKRNGFIDIKSNLFNKGTIQWEDFKKVT